MAQNMNQANIDQLGAWRAAGNTGDLPMGWTASSSGGGGGGGGGASIDPVAIAKQLQEYQIQQNQPAIATLGSQQSSLQASYGSLLDSIKGGQQVAVNSQTSTTNNEMAQRGILPTSTLYGQNMNNALLPVNSNYNSLYATTGQAEQQDLLTLAGQIAGLQAGNVQGAIGGAGQFGNIAAALAMYNPYSSAGSGLVLNQKTGQLTVPNVAGSSNTTGTDAGGGVVAPPPAGPIVAAAQQQQQAINNAISSFSSTPINSSSAALAPVTKKKTNNPINFTYNPNATPINTHGLNFDL